MSFLAFYVDSNHYNLLSNQPSFANTNTEFFELPAYIISFECFYEQFSYIIFFQTS